MVCQSPGRKALGTNDRNSPGNGRGMAIPGKNICKQSQQKMSYELAASILDDSDLSVLWPTGEVAVGDQELKYMMQHCGAIKLDSKIYKDHDKDMQWQCLNEEEPQLGIRILKKDPTKT